MVVCVGETGRSGQMIRRIGRPDVMLGVGVGKPGGSEDEKAQKVGWQCVYVGKPNETGTVRRS